MYRYNVLKYEIYCIVFVTKEREIRESPSSSPLSQPHANLMMEKQYY